MLVIGLILSIVAISIGCWLLYTLAVFALPAFVGVTIGLFAYHAGAGLAGAIVVGGIAASLTLVVLQAGLAFARPLWLRVVFVLAFVAPAAIAGFHATHGIIKHIVPSPAWQIAFSLVGGAVVGVTAFVRLTAFAAPAGQGPNIAPA